jgi:hypothetical protein
LLADSAKIALAIAKVRKTVKQPEVEGQPSMQDEGREEGEGSADGDHEDGQVMHRVQKELATADPVREGVS